MQACILYDAYGTRRIGATRATRYFPAIALVAAEPLEPASASLENLVPPARQAPGSLARRLLFWALQA